MKSAKTRIVFGVLDLVAAGYAVCQVHQWQNDSFKEILPLFLPPMLLPVPIALYNLRPLIRIPVRPAEFWICTALAAAAIGMVNFNIAAWVIQDFGDGIFRWVGDTEWAGIVSATLLTAAALITVFYSMHKGIPLRFICSVCLRCGIAPMCLGLGVHIVAYLINYSQITEFGMEIGVLGVFFLYLTETILYLRTGWKERTPREAI